MFTTKGYIWINNKKAIMADNWAITIFIQVQLTQRMWHSFLNCFTHVAKCLCTLHAIKLPYQSSSINAPSLLVVRLTGSCKMMNSLSLTYIIRGSFPDKSRSLVYKNQNQNQSHALEQLWGKGLDQHIILASSNNCQCRHIWIEGDCFMQCSLWP